MYLDEFDKIVLEPIDTFDIQDKHMLRLVHSIDGKVFKRSRPVSIIDRTIIHRSGGWTYDDLGNKFYDGPEELTEDRVRSDDSEFYAFQFWFNAFLLTKDAELFFTRVERWVMK